MVLSGWRRPVNISAFTETEETYESATAALQIEEGKIYAFKINDSMINIDTLSGPASGGWWDVDRRDFRSCLRHPHRD